MIVLDQKLLDQVLCNIREAARREAVGALPERFPVWLHVYDLSHTARYVLNNWLSKEFGLGAFHCGIEVLGAEWSFQAPSGQSDGENDERTGLMCHHAKVHPVHVYSESVYLGESSLKVSDIWNVLLQLEREWLARSYHAICRNCTDFAEAFAAQLRVQDCIPDWVHGIAKGYLQHTPLAAVDSNFLPRSSTSVSDTQSLRGYPDQRMHPDQRFPSSREAMSSREANHRSVIILEQSPSQDPSEIDQKLPVNPATPSDGSIRIFGEPRAPPQGERKSLSGSKSQVFVVPAQRPSGGFSDFSHRVVKSVPAQRPAPRQLQDEAELAEARRRDARKQALIRDARREDEGELEKARRQALAYSDARRRA